MFHIKQLRLERVTHHVRQLPSTEATGPWSPRAAKAGLGAALPRTRSARSRWTTQAAGGGDSVADCWAGLQADVQKQTTEPHRGRVGQCTRCAGLAAWGRCAHAAAAQAAQCTMHSVGDCLLVHRRACRLGQRSHTLRTDWLVHLQGTCRTGSLHARGWARAQAAQSAVHR